MAVNLVKPGTNLNSNMPPIREITPVHLIDEEDTMPKPMAPTFLALDPAPAAKPVPTPDPKPALAPDPKPVASSKRADSIMGILERQQTLEDNRKMLDAKIGQATVFKAKKDLVLVYSNDILEQGHRIVFWCPTYDHYGLDKNNLTMATAEILLLFNKSTHTIKFDISHFDACFEPDWELSKLYSDNPIVRFFRRKKIDAYLETVKIEILRTRAMKALEARDAGKDKG